MGKAVVAVVVVVAARVKFEFGNHKHEHQATQRELRVVMPKSRLRKHHVASGEI